MRDRPHPSGSARGPASRAPARWAALVGVLYAAPLLAQSPQAAGRADYPWNYPGVRERVDVPAAIAGTCAAVTPQPRVLIAGDSWAQFMWDDNTHNLLFDRFGHADKRAISRSLGQNPGPGYTGPEYAISGSEAREWVQTASYPWIANVLAELQAQPSIDSVMLSIGGNDILAGRSGGGWYKDMDLDQPGAEAALFGRILDHTQTIADAFLAVRPALTVLVSSYEYPNFNVTPLWCGIYACPKRRDLSRDPVNALVTDAELNAMNLQVETRRIQWSNGQPRIDFDHSVGAMHHYYGDGQAAPGVLPRPGQQAPAFLPFPGGNPARPSLRSNFRTTLGISADPIHLNPAGYRYKVALQTETHYFPRFRGEVSASLSSQGGNRDGWTDGVQTGTEAVAVGAASQRLIRGIVSFDTSAVPANAEISHASLYLLLDTRSGANPLTGGALGAPRLDVARGGFGAPELQAGDWDAPATASDAGCFVGTADAGWDALRIDLTPAGLAAIARGGLTQFRIGFTLAGSATLRMNFKDGDAAFDAQAGVIETVELIEERQPDGRVITRAVRGSVVEHRGLAEVLGSARPVLDLRFATPVFADGFEAGP
ncbi:MAG: hypothetical protein MUE46_08560 [Xanthomonadales bacterium]|jgi:lysophospholipase L1-like esterase|nr:hypothetical protein [Xanthomonadales bacterium]